MPATLTPQEFVNKWRKSTLTERAASQEHFIDLCRLVGHKTPAGTDPRGKFFTFETSGWSRGLDDDKKFERLLALCMVDSGETTGSEDRAELNFSLFVIQYIRRHR